MTGFGLAGHALEMAKGSEKTFCISLSSLPVMKGAPDYASMGFIPTGAYRNREFAEEECEFAWKNCDVGSKEKLSAREDLVFDPQTSGGLLLSIAPQDAGEAISRLSSLSLPCAVIGHVIDLQKKHLVFVK